MTTRRAAISAAAVISVMLLAGLVAWPHLPEQMSVHWNAADDADGNASRTFGVLFAPVVAAVMAVLLFWLPSIDPLRRGFKAFRKEYDLLILLLIGFFALMHAMILAWNLGARFEFTRIVGPCIGLLCYYIGTIMPKMERNHFAGIRTPWTLSSDRVWNRTHRHGGHLFRISGALASLAIVFHDYALPLILVPITASALWATLYSYLVYRKHL